jgi:hypothetical protein
LLAGCSLPGEENNNADQALARVGNKTLYLSEMEGMFPDGTSAQDSAAIIQAYVSRWVREAVLLGEAEAHIPADLNIDKLVRDYRASLVRSSYEKMLVEQLLDSTITQEELQAFYTENQMLYQLETPIVRCYFLKVPMPMPEGDRLRRLWNEDDPGALADLRDYAEQYAEVALLEDSLWYSLEEVAEELPKGTITASNVSSKREFTQQDGQHQYFFRLFELRNRKEIAPLSYVEEQARKVILHKRKLTLIEEVKEEMYERELRRNNIETFIN